jgi:signal peptidase II
MLPLCIALAIGIFDQATKLLIQKHFVLHESVCVVPGIFDLRYIQNTGAAWGIFAGGHLWLALLSVVMLIVIVVFRKSFLTDGLMDRICLGLIIGGIVGNLVDRVRLQYVVDFLDFYWRTHHFPAFNVADSAICVGVGLYIASQIMTARNASRGNVEGAV